MSRAKPHPAPPPPQQQKQPPLLRQGPRPLPLHLSLSLGSWLSSPIGLMLSMHASTRSKALPEPLASLAQSLLQQNPRELGPSLSRVVGENLAKLTKGIERYRTHPYQRQLDEPKSVWNEGSTRLLDYGGSGPPVLFVPSLVNRAYILDLDEKRSLLRWLSARGLHPYLVDWGAPEQTERDFGLEDYIIRLDAILAHLKKPPHLVGYCMGGNLALASALRNPDKIRSLALLATPWDFHADGKAEALRAALLYQSWRPWCALNGGLPVDLLQSLFTLLDPLGPQKKFMKLADMDDGHELESFVALEDWLNDGMVMPLPVADTCLGSWYERNDPATLNWMVEGAPVCPAQLAVPALVIVPQQDRIVPPASALALANALPSRSLINLPLGHVGMIVSREAPTLCWHPLLEWLKR